MELIAKISKGSRMDQVYIPKNRIGFSTGSYVILRLLEEKKQVNRLYFYNIKQIEPAKLDIINEIISAIDKNSYNYENIIITGSFLDNGFNFNDIDILIIGKKKFYVEHLENSIENKLGIKTHIIVINNETLIEGLSSDPMYSMMLSKCIAKKRFIYKIKPKINYKILDLHLLKSKTLIDNFDLLDGNEKYYLTRNMVAISLYLNQKKIDNEIVEREIIKNFRLKNIKQIKQNMIDKKQFLKKYNVIYKKTFNKIMDNINHGAKQKEIN